MNEDITLLGANVSFKPNPANAPTKLSQDAKAAWRSILAEDYNKRLMASVATEQAWKLALGMVFDSTSGLGQDFLDPAFTSRSAENRLMGDVDSMRARLAAAIDSKQVLKSFDTRSVSRAVNATSEYITLYAASNLSTPLPKEEVTDFLSMKGFTPRAGKWDLINVMPGIAVSISDGPQGWTLETTLTVKNMFLPKEVTSYYVNYERYKMYLLKKIWLPAVRKHRYTTSNRKNILL